MSQFKATTIVAVKRNGRTVLAADGQVTFGQQIIFKGHARKIRRLYNDTVVAGFAGGAADGFAMCEEFEKLLNKHSGSIMRSAVEFVKNIRTNGHANTEAMLIVADKDTLLILSNAGDLIEPDDGVCAIGSGGNFALSAAKALMENTDLDAKQIALKSMEIASSICVYTNDNFIVEEV